MQRSGYAEVAGMHRTQHKREAKSKRCVALSPDSLRRYPGLENLTDQEAKDAVDSIDKLCVLLFSFLKNDEINMHEES